MTGPNGSSRVFIELGAAPGRAHATGTPWRTIELSA